MVLTHTHTHIHTQTQRREKNFSSIAGKKFSLSNFSCRFFSFSFENFFSLFWKLLFSKFSHNLIQIVCDFPRSRFSTLRHDPLLTLRLSAEERSDGKNVFNDEAMREKKNHFELFLMKSSIFLTFINFLYFLFVFVAFVNFHEHFSSEILQTFNLFTSTLKFLFSPNENFFSHIKIFFFTRISIEKSHENSFS